MRKLRTALLGTVLALVSIPQAMAGTRYYENKLDQDITLMIYPAPTQSSGGTQVEPKMKSVNIPAGQKKKVTFEGTSIRGAIVKGPKVYCDFFVTLPGDHIDTTLNFGTNYAIVPGMGQLNTSINRR